MGFPLEVPLHPEQSRSPQVELRKEPLEDASCLQGKDVEVGGVGDERKDLC